MMANHYPLYVAVNSQNQVVGWCDVVPKRHEGLTHVGVLALGVRKEYRGGGVGSKLLTQAIAHTKQMGLEKMELDVFESNRSAIRLYEEFGFTLEGRKVKSRKLDGTYDNILLMGKFL
jgi:ribosomal protein S18 acetylase RimI-like enzyme